MVKGFLSIFTHFSAFFILCVNSTYQKFKNHPQSRLNTIAEFVPHEIQKTSATNCLKSNKKILSFKKIFFNFKGF